jgi:U4/U6 small nuclear ribonucleoprotein PRP31
MTKIDLKSHLPSATVMVVTVTSTTTTGRTLDEQELELIYECCDAAEEMDMKKNKLLGYVSSRMTLMAPNLSILLGSPIAAKLMGIAGGLTPLSKIPASNVLVLGAEKKTTALGLSRVTMGMHMGYIYECDLVQNAPSHIQRKAARLLSAKCALAVRVDLSRNYTDGRYGYEYREDVQKKIALLVEPPPSKKVKALPLPIEFKKKRGNYKHSIRWC